ncbi:MAG TPA: hypothetical protein VFX35_01960 [Solirubrobacterales bacterium]|nr:hypothetical protein [Solirubrobacterales bacterium]
MRSEDMKIGHAYQLGGRGYRKVTVLETPSEVRSKARVRVRFENGVKAGTVSDLPSRRIARPWRDEQAQGQPRQPGNRSEAPPLPSIERPVRSGDTVRLLGDESGLLWTVDAIRGEMASLRTDIFGRPSARQVAVASLQVHHEPVRPQVIRLLDDDDSDTGDRLDEERWAALHLRPERPKRDLDRILDQLVFSQACLGIYRRRLAPHLKGSAVAEGLREEIRRKGFLMRGEEVPGPEYARLRVWSRFDIVLDAPPLKDEAVMISWLHFPVKHTKSARRRRQQAA